MSTDLDSKAPPREPRSYGNWYRRTSPGLYGKSIAVNVLLGGGSIIGILLMFFTGSWKIALAWFVPIVLLATMLSIRDGNKRTLGQNLLIFFQFSKAKRTGTNLFRSGPLMPLEKIQLPGGLCSILTAEYTDSHNRIFALIGYPHGEYVVALECQPDGAGSVDQDDIDLMVARYGAWLTEHPSIEGLIASAVIVETSPDSGHRLTHAINTLQVDTAPPFATAVLDRVKKTYPKGSAALRAYITMTFSGQGRVPKTATTHRARMDAMGAALAQELGALVADLNGSGAGVVTPMDIQALAEVVRTAYDPEFGPVIDGDRAEGLPPHAMTLQSAGPVATEATWGHLVHDSGASVTAMMSVPPRNAVHELLFGRMLAADSRVVRLRVAILYRPIPSDEAADEVESQHTNAIFNQSGAKKQTAVSDKAVNAAAQAAKEEANGAGVVSFAIVATATVRSVEDIADAKAALTGKGRKARIRMRVCWGSQDSTFPATLPLGFRPEAHGKLPEAVSAAMK